MAAIKRFLTNWWFVSITAALLVALLLCVGLPLVVGFLRPWWVRLLSFTVVALVWGAMASLRARKAQRGSDAIAAALAATDTAGDEGKVVAKRMAEALAQLKTSTAGTKQRDYLYSRPWYIIIGPPGAGKTTALVNSGLRFPFADQSLMGSGGTRNLDFMFADEAVLVDTAGRYTSQDSDASVDAKGWNSFLTLLRKNRPLQPVNGIIVAIGIDELVRGDRSSIDNHAAAVRRRLAELRSSLELAVPVYVWLTKADLLAGFIEYFDDLDVEGRRAVLGHTLPLALGRPSAQSLAKAFDEMARDVSARQAKRLSEEPDAARRALILGFPAQLEALRARLLRFLDGAFVSGDEPTGLLRGVYLTSGVQQGAPLDRILSGMTGAFATPAPAERGSGRAYFLNRLLNEVIFPEAGAVQMDARARTRQRSRLVGALVAIGAFALLTMAAWMVSFFGNRSFQSTALAKAQEAQGVLQTAGIDLQEVRNSDPDLEASLDALRALRSLPQGYAERKAGEPGLALRFGLYQDGLSSQTQEAYREGVRRILLPRLLLDLETVIAANISNPLAVYEPLKIYLMLGSQGPMDKGAVRSWAENHWADAAYPGADRAAVRKELGAHLDTLLADDSMAGVWPRRRAPLDGGLIASARGAIQQMSLAEHAYAILRQKAAAGEGAPWSVTSVLASGDGQAFVNGDAVLALSVPYFFTRAGFEKSYQLALATVQTDLRKDLWVMGGDADTTAVREQVGSVRSGVAALYARDYNAAWDAVIARLEPADYFHNPAALANFTRSPSPLKLVLLEVRKNTLFTGGSGAAKAMLGDKVNSALGNNARLLGAATGFDAGRDIEQHFKPIHVYVGDNKTPAPIDEFVNALKSAGIALNQAQLSAGGFGADAAQAASAGAIAAVNAAAAGAPAQLQPFVVKLAQGGGAAQVGAATGAVATEYASTVLPACQQAASERYPFYSASATDLSVVDATRVFGLGGVIDRFVQTRLAPMLQTAGPVWRWQEGNPVAATFDPANPDQLAKAAEIRDLLTAGLILRVEAQGMTGGVDAVVLQSGDAVLRFDKANMAPRQLRWSLQGGTPEASITLFEGSQQVVKLHTEGIWALFRLIEKARRENAGPTVFLATFGEGARKASLRIGLPTEKNPFAKGGVWTFRCPTTL